MAGLMIGVNGGLLIRNGRLVISSGPGEQACCFCGGTCLCPNTPDRLRIKVTVHCGVTFGVMQRVAGTPGCDPKWQTVAPVPISCRLTAFPAGECGYPFEVEYMFCFQNGLCVRTFTIRDVPNDISQQFTNTMTGTCDPFYHTETYPGSGLAGRCGTYLFPPNNIKVEVFV